MPAENERKRRGLTEEEDAKNDSLASSAVPISKKSKSRHRFRSFLLIALLITGVVTGMHTSGFIDVRPYIWNVAQRIPLFENYLKTHFNIPEIYTLTVAERRKLELQQWQDRLDIRERELQAKAAQTEFLSSDLVLRQQKIDKKEADLLEKEKGVNTKGKDATPEEEALMKEITDTYQEISPRRAAQIMAQLPDHLAAELMKKLSQDARASILAKMDPKRAARITERLANP
ncbi:MAG: hypothetical protein FWF87_03305 [Synergistaceae bacterium]|nr:hypothetical protein [Synergistaceae bacterium]